MPSPAGQPLPGTTVIPPVPVLPPAPLEAPPAPVDDALVGVPDPEDDALVAASAPLELVAEAVVPEALAALLDDFPAVPCVPEHPATCAATKAKAPSTATRGAIRPM